MTINDGVLKRSDLGSDRKNKDKKSMKHVLKGDLVYNPMFMWKGASGISSYEGITSADYIVLKSKKNVNQIFFSHLFQTEKSLNKFKNYSQGSLLERLRLMYPQFSDIKMAFPSYEEQEKIANFLTSVDNKIELLEKKYQSYLNFKKYLMQQIFAQKLRFADDESEWQEIRLKDIGIFYRGHSYTSSNVVDDGLLVLRSNNIKNNVLDFSEDGLQFVNKDCKKELELQKNDIVICMSNGTRRLVGKSAEYIGNYPSKLTVGAFCSIFRTNNKLAKYLFQTEIYKKNLYLILAGTNINNLKNSDLEKF